MWLTILIWEIVSFKNPWAITTDQNSDLTNKKWELTKKTQKLTNKMNKHQQLGL